MSDDRKTIDQDVADSTVQVIHTVLRLDPEGGGPSVTVPALCQHLKKERPGWSVEITTDPQTVRALGEGRSPHLLHDHGQWRAVNHASALASRRRGVPRIVSPRGMLSPWARNSKRWKKWLGWQLYARRDLAETVVIHATSELELRELREFGVKQPVAVIPNGVEPFDPLAGAATKPANPYVLFLSRIHEKKGVLELLDVWRDVVRDDWELVLAGPDEQGLLARCALPKSARYVGMVGGASKTRLLQEASLFVLPTYSENFGVVVAESLMAGVPAITTHGAPWECLVEQRCGWWIDMTPSRLRDTLQTAMAIPPAELYEMGQRGSRLVRERFSWPEIARKMASVYEWILGGGAPPDCVDV
ncbi:MAG: glycosyltransferase [Planctomycetales bacterium]|nr:glycosyltransferase [Planctomycetales bacterium]